MNNDHFGVTCNVFLDPSLRWDDEGVLAGGGWGFLAGGWCVDFEKNWIPAYAGMTTVLTMGGGLKSLFFVPSPPTPLPERARGVPFVEQDAVPANT